MNKKNKIISVLLCMALLLGVMSGCGKKEVSEDTITFLSCWNGDSVRDFEGGEENPIWKAIYERTGVKINVEYINVSEVEKLNQIFAAGTDADLVAAPMWGMDDPQTTVIKKAVEEGMLMPLDDLVEEYGPNLKPSFTKGLTEDFIKYDLVPEAAEGKHYILPSNVKPVERWGEFEYQDGIYIRKDILEDLGIDRYAIKTSEDLYEIMKLVKKKNYKDINGRSVIVGGLTSKGGGTRKYAASYIKNKGKLTGMDIDENGHVSDDFFSPYLDKEILFIRKLVSEGLLDVEGLSQNDVRAKEKIANGMYAIIPWNYDDLYSTCKDTLYKTNPEMEYVPLANLVSAEGSTTTYKLNGTGGCEVLFIPSSSKKAETVIKLLNYLSTEEGNLLVMYGIEGVHWKYDDEGYVVRIGEAANKTSQELFKMGIGTFYRLCGVRDFEHISKKRKDDYSEEKKFALEFFDRETVLLDGTRLSYLELLHPRCEDFRAMRSNTIQNDAKQMAYTAASDKEALGYINKIRKQMLDEGIEEVWKYVEDEMAKHPDQKYID